MEYITRHEYKDYIYYEKTDGPIPDFAFPAFSTDLNIENLQKSILEILKDEKASFNIIVSRANKEFQFKNAEFSTLLNDFIAKNTNLSNNHDCPNTLIQVTVFPDCFFCFKAAPIQAKDKGSVVCLLSGGFDSPVAVYTMLRNGYKTVLVHYTSQPYGDWRSSVQKVRSIVHQLKQFGGPDTFYCIGIGEQQRRIALDAPSELRVTLYRRLMMRIAKAIALENNCSALVTGDSLGQVASQTIESMTTIESVITPMIILRPLLTYTKEEIISKARDIGTAELSVLPAGDCCSHMLPKKVSTRPSIEYAVEGESKLDIEEMVRTALDGAQIIDINDEFANDDDGCGEACPLEFQE